MRELSLQDVIVQQRSLLKRGQRLCILPPTIKDLRMASASLTDRTVIEIEKNGRVYLEPIGNKEGDFDAYLRSREFNPDSWLLLNRINGAEQAEEKPSLVQSVPNGEEFICSVEKGVRIGVFSPYGLGVAMREDGAFSPEWRPNRELVISWQNMGQYLQVMPYYENAGHSGIFGVHDIIGKHLSTSKNSFTVRIPELEYIKLHCDSIITNFVRAFLFTWKDLERFMGNKSLESLDIFQPGYNWQIFWTNISPAKESAESKLAGAPEFPVFVRPINNFNPFEDHHEIMEELKSFQHVINFREGVTVKVLVLNFDSHNDQGYGDNNYLHRGNWAFLAEKNGLARVVHFQSYYRDNGASAGAQKDEFNWNTEARRASLLREITSILKGEEIREIWLSIDFDAFSLNQPITYEPGWTSRVFHLEIERVKAELLALKGFLGENKIGIHRVLRFSSPTYLNLPEENKHLYIQAVDTEIKRIF